jgi:hypothetical protein
MTVLLFCGVGLQTVKVKVAVIGEIVVIEVGFVSTKLALKLLAVRRDFEWSVGKLQVNDEAGILCLRNALSEQRGGEVGVNYEKVG